WSNKDLKVSWQHHTSKLEPGRKETWTAVITGPSAQKAVAEMVATLYDESLDAYLPHRWMQKLQVFRQDHSNLVQWFENMPAHLQPLSGNWPVNIKPTPWTYRYLPHDIAGNFWGYQWANGRGGAYGFAGGKGGVMPMAGMAPPPGAPMMKGAGKFKADPKEAD